MNPTWSNGVDLAWDVGAVFVPCVPGSYAKKVFKFASKAHGSGKLVKKGSKVLGKLKSIGKNTWKSSAGLIYKNGSKHGNRVRHVLEHLKPYLTKPTHTVFNVTRKEVLKLIDEAWSNKGNIIPKLGRGKAVYDINMGRMIGTSGETKIRIVVEHETSEIITAYPVK